MAQISSLVLAYLILSLGVMQAADILINGSIFEGLRDRISYQRDRGNVFFKVLNQLFTCMLCMTTQVALWLTWMPCALVADRYFDNPVVSTLVGLVGAFGIGGTALGIWMLFQYSPKRYHALQQENLRLVNTVEELRAAKTVSRITKKDRDALRAALTPDTLSLFYATMEGTCSDIGCSMMRAYCYGEVLNLLFTEWKMSHPVAVRFPGLLNAVAEAISSYMHSVRGHPSGSPRHEEMLAVEHANLLRRMGVE